MADFILYIGRSAVIPFDLTDPVDEGATLLFVAKRNVNAATLDISSSSIVYDPSTQRGTVTLLNDDTDELSPGTLQCEVQAEYASGENYVVATGEAEVRAAVIP